MGGCMGLFKNKQKRIRRRSTLHNKSKMSKSKSYSLVPVPTSPPLEDVKYLQDATHFTEDDLRNWYKTFISDYKRGFITRREFKYEYVCRYPDGEPDDLADFMFLAFDRNADNMVDFKEFMIGLSLSTTDNIEEKLGLVFTIYDVNKDGFITKEELLSVLEAVANCNDGKPKISPTEWMGKVFKCVDKGNTGKMTLNNFVECIKNDKELYHELTKVLEQNK